MDHPYTWWDSLSDEAVDFWKAYWRVEPWGCEWERHAVQVSSLEHIFAAIINQHVEKGKEYKPGPFASHMPPDYYEEKLPTPEISNDDMADKLDAFVRATSR